MRTVELKLAFTIPETLEECRALKIPESQLVPLQKYTPEFVLAEFKSEMETGCPFVKMDLLEGSADAKRLDYLIQSGARVCHSKDGDVCWLVWENPDDDDCGGPISGGVFDTPREAIDDAMAAREGIQLPQLEEE